MEPLLAMLQSPGVIIPDEANYLINPTQPDFEKFPLVNPIRLRLIRA